LKLALITTFIISLFIFNNGDTISPAPVIQNVNQDSGGKEKNSRIAVVGDLQRTSIWELVLGREQNDVQRSQIINSISDENPAMLVLLGDMVFDGSSRLQWDFFDSLVQPIRDKNIPLNPVLGNHEYWGKKNISKKMITGRFPVFKENSWYALTHEGLALIFLNSNESDMTSLEWKTQREWYNNRIYHFENDPSIKGIFVFTHHPPFTNSTITTDEIHVQKTFTPAFLKAKKTIAFISGHAHTYERFKKEGKTFIVSGGGGGPRVLLKFGPDCHEDLCKDDSRKRPFHYLLISQNDNEVEIEVKALNEDTGKFYILEKNTFPILYQSAEGAP
jgi:Icc-related predicted phosphoesterase